MDKAFIQQYQWKNRVLIVFTPNEMDEDYRTQHHALMEAEAGILERDLKVIHAFYTVTEAEGEATPSLHQAFEVDKDRFHMLLIGKDGTVKQQYDKPTPMETIFALIDSMPMRQQEMQKSE